MTDQRSKCAAKRLTVLACGASALALMTIFPQAASAQAALQEVVVTANRVESSAQRTSIAMDVIGAETIKAQGITSVTALASVSPSVNISGSSSAGSVVTIRGISSRDTTEIGDPAVVVSTDGFYQDRSYALALTQYDLQRIEVLRGPQGTLYGRNATGGAINIITVKPGKSAGGFLQLEGGSFNTLNSEGGVNLPITDRVQTRLSFSSVYHSGYRTGYPFGDVDDANARSGRLQFSAQPTENLDVHVLAQHTISTAAGSVSAVTPYRIDASGFIVHDVLPDVGDPKHLTRAAPGGVRLNDSVYRWDAVYRTPVATVTYLGGYDRLKYDSFAPTFGFSGPVTATNPKPSSVAQVFHQNERPITTNHELRFTAPDQDARLTWQAGVFYFNNHNALDSFQYTPNGTATPIPIIHFQYDVKIKSLAEMAQVGFKVTDTFKLTVGARHNKDEKLRSGYIFSTQVRPANATLVTTGTTVKKNTYHLGADWQATPSNLLYAKYDTGYKTGGFTDVAPYGPETVKTWEIGAKNRFFDNRVQLNVDLYSSDYSGQQVSQFVAQGGGTRIVNAGQTRLRGVEGDVAAALPFGRVEAAFAYLDAKFTDFALATTVLQWNGTSFGSTNTNLQLKGNRPQQAPKWTFSGAFEHRFDNIAGGSLTARISTKYQTKTYFTFFNRADDTQKAYALTNLLATYARDDAPWSLQAYVNNLTDEVILAGGGPGDRARSYAYSYQAPRTYGGRILYRW